MSTTKEPDATDPVERVTDPVTDPVESVTDPITDPVESVTDPVTDPVDRLLLALDYDTLASSQIQQRLGLRHRPTFRENYLRPAVARHLIDQTIPERPSSRMQQYRLSPEGAARLADLKEERPS